jgi:predicted NBD/HSP70 family sugar kinase
MAMPVNERAETLRRHGQIDSGFAIAIALSLLIGMVNPGTALIIGSVAVWLAVRGRQMYEQAVPLEEAERRELDRLRGQSRHVRQLLDALQKAGQEPLRYDLIRCRQLAKVESLLSSGT